MRIIAILAACLWSISLAYAAGPSAEVQAHLQAAMLAHTDAVSQDGAYTYIDTTENALKTVYPANVHPFVVTIGGHFVVCSEMIDDDGNAVTADFLIQRFGDDYRVVQMIVNNREALQKAMRTGN